MKMRKKNTEKERREREEERGQKSQSRPNIGDDDYETCSKIGVLSGKLLNTNFKFSFCSYLVWTCTSLLIWPSSHLRLLVIIFVLQVHFLAAHCVALIITITMLAVTRKSKHKRIILAMLSVDVAILSHS